MIKKRTQFTIQYITQLQQYSIDVFVILLLTHITKIKL